MAKDNKGGGQARVRIFYADVEAGDEATEKVLHSVATAFARALQPPQRPVMRALPPAPQGNGKPAAAQGELFDDAGQPVEPVEPLQDDEMLDAAPADRTTPKKPREKRKAQSYTFVKDLNLHPDGKKPLRDFFAEKKPGDAQEQFAVILFYLTDTLGLTGIGANHIYSGFREVEKKFPVDILQTARNIANRKGWIDSSDSENLRLTPKGLNFVSHDLPRGENAAAPDAEE